MFARMLVMKLKGAMATAATIVRDRAAADDAVTVWLKSFWTEPPGPVQANHQWYVPVVAMRFWQEPEVAIGVGSVVPEHSPLPVTRLKCTSLTLGTVFWNLSAQELVFCELHVIVNDWLVRVEARFCISVAVGTEGGLPACSETVMFVEHVPVWLPFTTVMM